jgi:hypothetical protein
MVGRVGIEPTIIGLKVRNIANKRHTIQPLTGATAATYAQLCTTVHNCAQLIHAKLTQRAGLMLKNLRCEVH